MSWDILKWAVVAISVVGLVAVLSGCGHYRHHGHHRGLTDKHIEKVTKRVTRKLELNAEQQEKLRVLAQAVQKSASRHHELRRDMVVTLEEQLARPQMDKAVLLGMHAQHSDMMQNVMPEIIDELVAFHQSLNAEQREKLLKKLQHFSKHRHHG